MTPETGDAQATGDSGSIEHAAGLIADLARKDDAGDSEAAESPQEGESAPETAEAQSAEAEPAAADEQPPEQETPRYKVKADGQELEVTLDELLKGYSREADYTRKTQAVAEERKAFEAERSKRETELSAQREQYKAVLDFWEQQISQAMGTPEQLESLRQTDPQAYALAVADRVRYQENLQNIRAKQTELKAQDEAKTRTEQEGRIKAEMQMLVRAVPEWSDPEKHRQGTQSLFEYATKVRGFKQDELAGISDHRIVLALRDAAAYHALQQQKPEIQRKVEAVKTVKPGTATRENAKITKATEAFQRLNKSGRLEDAAETLKHLLSG